MESSDQRSF